MRPSAAARLVVVASLWVAGPAAAESSTQRRSDVRVWSTQVRCAAPHRVRVAITYDDKTVYRGQLALCQIQASSLPAQTAPRVTTFSFFGRPRDLAPMSVDQAQQIEGRLWEVSADVDSIRLGIAFSTTGDILLNTTRAVPPGAATRDTLASSLAIATDPPAAR
ncbi:MAG: hypothetical protein ABL961_16080 [Vicinamibacterales bacterium]